MLTRADRALLVILALGAVLAWPLAAVAGGAGERVVITSPAGETTLSLHDEAKVAVAGALGEVTVVVRDDRVWVAESGCPDQTCVHTGAVSASGQVVACVPNRVVVRVEGGADDGLDARIR